MLAHGHDLGHNRVIGPLDAKDLRKLLKILSRSLADGEDGVAEPAHAQTAELLVEKLYAELRSEKGYVFDDGQSDAPLLVLGKLDDRREEGLGEELDADDCSLSDLMPDM